MKYPLCQIGLFGLFLIIPTLNMMSQTLSVYGKVLNQETAEPVSYCSLTIGGTHRGTIANAEGEFELFFPDTLLTDTLVFSAIGFHQYSILLDSLNQTDSLGIQLVPNEYTLNEVLLLSEEINAKDVLEKAIANIKNTYSRKPYYLKAFFREMNFQDEVYQRLIEAAVNIYDPGVQKDPTRLRIKVEELRKSEDYRELSFFQKGLSLIAGAKQNSIVSLMYWNPTRYHLFQEDRPWAPSYVWLRQSFLTQYSFEFTDLVKEGEQEYFKIRFTLPDSLKTQEVYMKEGSLLIHTEDFGIRRFTYIYRDNPFVSSVTAGLGEEKFLYKLDVSYKKVQDRYYPSKILLTSSGVDGLPFNFDVTRDNKQVTGGLRGTTLLLQVTGIVTDKKQMEKIKKRDREKRGVDLYEKEFEYNATFWEGYNSMPIDRKYISAKDDLERKMSLQKQFDQN